MTGRNKSGRSVCMRRSAGRIGLLCIVVFLLVSGLAGCSTMTKGTAESGAKQSERPLDKVRLRLVWQPTPESMEWWVGMEKGFFKEEGIELDAIAPADPTDSLKLVASGQGDFGVTYPEDLVLASQAGSDLISIGSIFAENGTGIASTDPKIKNPKQLKGKTVGLVSLATIQKRWLSMVENVGLKPDDVKTIDTQFSQVAWVMNGRLQNTAVLYFTEGVELETKGKKLNVMFFKDYGSPNSYGQILITNRKLAKDNPDLVRRFLAAAYKSIQYVVDNPAQSAQIFSKKFPETDSKANLGTGKAIGKFYQTKERSGRSYGYQDAPTYDTVVKWMFDNKMITKKLKGQDLFTNEFLPNM